MRVTPVVVVVNISEISNDVHVRKATSEAMQLAMTASSGEGSARHVRTTVP